VVELDGYYDGSFLVVVSPPEVVLAGYAFSEHFCPVLFVYWWDYAIMLDIWLSVSRYVS
jgi:hypothetical protein